MKKLEPDLFALNQWYVIGSTIELGLEKEHRTQLFSNSIRIISNTNRGKLLYFP